MTMDNLYSVRMRASSGGRHVSGAERVVSAETITHTVNELVARAVMRGAVPDDITIRVESLQGIAPYCLASLDVTSVAVTDPLESRAAVAKVLQWAGVGQRAVETAISSIERGAAPSGTNMRGAMIVDAQTGERLEQDRERGVRVSRFDWTPDAREAVEQALVQIGLRHFRTREALALATKVAYGPGVRAELCWSDDPHYTAGYAASRTTGYVRLPFLKKEGDDKGGRAIFIDRGTCDLQDLLKYLHSRVVLINAAGMCSTVLELESHLIRH